MDMSFNGHWMNISDLWHGEFHSTGWSLIVVFFVKTSWRSMQHICKNGFSSVRFWTFFLTLPANPITLLYNQFNPETINSQKLLLAVVSFISPNSNMKLFTKLICICNLPLGCGNSIVSSIKNIGIMDQEYISYSKKDNYFKHAPFNRKFQCKVFTDVNMCGLKLYKKMLGRDLLTSLSSNGLYQRRSLTKRLIVNVGGSLRCSERRSDVNRSPLACLL